MKRFVLNRIEDISGVSGTGVVAEGVQFDDGTVALKWMSATPTTELLDSMAAVEEIHGHEGATQIEFIDHVDTYGNLAQNITKSLKVLKSDLFISVSIDKSEIQTLTDNLQKSLYISIDADNAGNKIALAESKDDEFEARKISNKINAGLYLFKDWIKNEHGYIIEMGGDEALAKIPKLNIKQLKSFISEYKDLTGFTLTVGVGKKLSQATNARMLGKLKGKNRIEVWKRSSKKEINDLMYKMPKTPQEKFKEAGLLKAEGPGSRGGHISGYTSSGKPIYGEPAHKETTRLGEAAPTHLFKPHKKEIIGITPFGRTVHHDSRHPAHKNFTNVDHQHAALINHHLAGKFPEGSEQKLKHELNRNDHILEAAKNQNINPKKLLTDVVRNQHYPSEKYLRANNYFVNPHYVSSVVKDVLKDKK